MTRAKSDAYPTSGFGLALRREREKAKMTREQLAVAAGCSYQTVVKLEVGTQEPAWPLALAFARALGIDVRDVGVFAVLDGTEKVKGAGGRPRKAMPDPEPSEQKPPAPPVEAATEEPAAPVAEPVASERKPARRARKKKGEE